MRPRRCFLQVTVLLLLKHSRMSVVTNAFGLLSSSLWRRGAATRTHEPGHQSYYSLSAAQAIFDDTSIAVGLHKIAGRDPDRPQKVNQDACFGFQVNLEDDEEDVITCLGVMDGHGLKGHKLTEYLAEIEQLPGRIRKYILEKVRSEEDQALLAEQWHKYETMGGAPPQQTVEDPIERALIDAMILAHYDACQNPDIPAGRAAGTTCVVCVMTKNFIYTASVGDSTAICGQVSAIDLATEGHVLDWQTLSTRTTVSSMPEEKARIEGQEDGRIVAGNVFYGPVGIAMTRALGDAVMLRAGVLPVPVVTKVPRIKHDDDEVLGLLVMGSDGVFDVMKPESVIQLAGQVIQEHESVERAAREVAEQSERAWLADLPIETKVDDITCIVMKL